MAAPPARLQGSQDLAHCANIIIGLTTKILSAEKEGAARRADRLNVLLRSKFFCSHLSHLLSSFDCISRAFLPHFLPEPRNMVVLRLSPLSSGFAALVLASTIVVSQIETVASAGFSPGGDLFGRFDQLPLPLPHPGRRRGGQLADTMSEALNELRETRVELTALREEMRSISEQRKVSMAASSSSTMSAGVGESSIMSMENDGGEEQQDVPPKLPKQPKRQPYSLGLTPQLD